MKDGFIKVGFAGYVTASRICAVQVMDNLCRVLFESVGELCSLDERCVSHEEALIHAERIVNDVEGMKKEGGAP